MFILSRAPTTSTSSHRDATLLLPSAELATFFFAWMYVRVLRKCRVIMSGVCTPSNNPGGARCDGWTSGDEMPSIADVISSTKPLTNFGVT